jgi:hypothetical protein
MKRRSFLTGLVAVGAAGWRRGAAQQPVTKAAVVLGVDQVGSLPKLKGAASGARSVSTWLAHEGFSVVTLTDAAAPVTAHQVFAEVARLVNAGTLEQLVVYFAGHGFISGYSEYWMLSGAPDDPNEAISVVESSFLAKQSAIPNVVIISDACRSRADSLQAEHVRGSLIFPNNRGRPAAGTDLDVFYATLVGDPAWETAVQSSVPNYSALFTATLMEAYKRPENSMVVSVHGQNVVPNRRLKPYLLREVPLRAQAVSVRMTQQPDIQVASSDSTYLGRVTTADRAGGGTDPAQPTVGEVADFALRNAGSGTHDEGYPASLRRLAAVSGFSDSASQIFKFRSAPQDFPAQTGVAVFGATPVAITLAAGLRGTVVAGKHDPAPVSVELNDRPAATAALRFSDGTGCVLSIIRGYIANVVVDGHGVSSVSYEPSRMNPLYDTYAIERDRIADLRAVVATASRFGVFRISAGADKAKEVDQLAQRIKVLKGIDATLGIYAAYALADADVPDQVRSIKALLRDLYNVDFFDVALLAGTDLPSPGNRRRVVPFCPMLSRGWSLLRVKNVSLLPGLLEARNSMRESLWTSFRAPGMKIIEALVANNTDG